MEHLYSPDHSDNPPLVERPPHLLLLVDDPEQAERLSTLARSDGFRVTVIPDVERVVRGSLASVPDLIVIAADIEQGEGIAACSDLRLHDDYRHTPIVLVARQLPDAPSVAHALLAGADDYATCDRARLVELSARLRVQLRNKRYRDTLGRVRAERDGLRDDVARDPLTGALNRRSLDALLRALPTEHTALCFVDVDHFKLVNDRYGHGVGDEVLRAVAQCLSRHVRSHDSIARYGGEEFVVVLRDVSQETARLAAERYRRAIEGLTFHERGGPAQVTVSIGVALFESPDERVEHVLSRADGALYFAKRTGRNRVVLSPTDMIPADVSIPPGSAPPRSTSPEAKIARLAP